MDRIRKLLRGEERLCEFLRYAVVRLVTLTSLQRRLRRWWFGSGRVRCVALRDEDRGAYQAFCGSVIAPGSLQSASHSGPAGGPERYVYVAWLKGMIVAQEGIAYQGQWQGYSVWFISGLRVDSSFQGMGIGEKLSRALCAQASRPPALLYRYVHKRNTRAKRLYAKLGYGHDAQAEKTLFSLVKHMRVPADEEVYVQWFPARPDEQIARYLQVSTG